MFNWQINGWILKECVGESQAGGLDGLNNIMAFILTRNTGVYW